MKDGLFLYSEHFCLRVLAQKSESPTLFAFIVPIKVKKTAVGRHLIKRKMTSVVENVLIRVKKGYYCLFFAKKETSLYTEIKKEIITLLEKAKMLNERLN